MRRSLWVLVLAIVAFNLLAAACAIFTRPGEIPVSQTLSQPAQAAQSAINESNVLLAAAANVVAQNYVDGVATQAEARAQIAKVKALAAQVGRAKQLLDAGDVATAGREAELAQKLIVLLHREVAARARDKAEVKP